jgi:hypothetical protein
MASLPSYSLLPDVSKKYQTMKITFCPYIQSRRFIFTGSEKKNQINHPTFVQISLHQKNKNLFHRSRSRFFLIFLLWHQHKSSIQSSTTTMAWFSAWLLM